MDKTICINMTCPLRKLCYRYSGPIDLSGEYYVVEWFYPDTTENPISCREFVTLEVENG